MKKVLGLLACICLAAALTTAAFADTHTPHDHAGWKEISSVNSSNKDLNGGNYYLNGTDNTLNNTGTNITVTGTVTLCFNGNSLTMKGASFTVNSDATLTICDCQGGGSISFTTDAGPSVSAGGVIKVNSGGTLSLESGTVTTDKSNGIYNESGTVHITGGTVKTTSSERSAIYNKGGKVDITGGTILSEKSAAGFYNGYGIASDGGEIKISDGKVEGKNAIKTDTNAATITITGGNIYGKETAIVTQKDDALTIGAATVTGGTYAIDNNGSLHLCGSPAITGGTNKAAIKASGGGSINAHKKDATGEAYTGGEVTVEVANAAKVGDVVINSVNNDNEGSFTVTNENYGLNRSGNNLALVSHSEHDFTSNIYRQVGNNQHRQKCIGCNKYSDAVACTYTDDGDCTTPGVCVCGRVMAAAQEHSFTDVYKQVEGAMKHQQKCANCSHYGDAVACVFDNDEDTECNFCGARKEVSGGNPPSTGGSGNTGGDTVDSAQTSDAGAAVYAGMALASAAGAVYAGKKRK